MKNINILLLGLLLISMAIYGQEELEINEGFNLIELQKDDNVFSCFYEDTNASVSSDIKVFQFPNIDRVYNIIIDGFEVDRNHKTYVLTNKDTVVRFEFSKISGEVQVKIRHNNLINNYIGSTGYFSRIQIIDLFKEFI